MTDYTPEYLAFYDEYPRKEGKKDGFKAWGGMPIAVQMVALEDVKKRNRHRAWAANKKLIPLPATYLRGARFEDDWFSTHQSQGKQDHASVGIDPAKYRQPQPDTWAGTRWDALGNRAMMAWLRAAGGLSPEELKRAVREKNAVVSEMSSALDEEMEAGTHGGDVAMMLYAHMMERLDALTGRELKEELVR